LDSLTTVTYLILRMLLSNSRTNTVGNSFHMCTVLPEFKPSINESKPSLRTVEHAQLTLKHRSSTVLKSAHSRPRLSMDREPSKTHKSRNKLQLTRVAPTQTRRDAKQQQKKRNRRSRFDYCAPCFPVTRRFKKWPYLTSFKLAANGFLRRFERSDVGCTIPAAIKSLCVDFAFEREAGIYQIAYQINRVMKKINKHSVTSKMVSALVAQYLKMGDSESEVTEFVSEMVRLRYIAEVQLDQHRGDKYHQLFVSETKEPLYVIPIDAALQFGRK